MTMKSWLALEFKFASFTNNNLFCHVIVIYFTGLQFVQMCKEMPDTYRVNLLLWWCKCSA
jgi:hypothetical protein